MKTAIKINKNDLGHILIYKIETVQHIYENYKALPNATVFNRGTDKEFIKFVTVNEANARKALKEIGK